MTAAKGQVAKNVTRVGNLLRLLRHDPAKGWHRMQIRGRMLWLDLRNRLSRVRVTGTGGAIVNLTSFGNRVNFVHYAIESIAAGRVKPGRLILWLDEKAARENLPPALHRLRKRGLEILECENFGPHKKQYAFALTDDTSGLPLVAADDDTLYPRFWLAGLIAAYDANHDVISGYRAHTIGVDGSVIAPYATWTPRASPNASYTTLCTGVSGIIYPAKFISALRAEGTGFRAVAPTADDIWVHAVAVRHGFRHRQVGVQQAEFLAIPETQTGSLYRVNVKEGGNDLQIQQSYGPIEIDRISEDQRNGR